MRIAFPTLSVVALASFALAQAPNNRHLFFANEDNSTANRFLSQVNAATRVGGNSATDDEVLSDVSATPFRGVGASSNTACAIAGQVFIIQDQDQTTQDNFKILVRKSAAPDGLPDVTATGLYAISGNITLPPGTGTGAIAWQYNLTWTTAVTVNCEAGYYVGLELLPGASATDFTLIQTANAISGTAPAFAGDNPRVPAPKFHAMRVLQPAGTATRSTSQRTLAIATLVNTPTLNLGNIDNTRGGYTCFGLGGLYPDTTRGDGLVARVEDGSVPGGIALVFLATGGYVPGGIGVPGIAGGLWQLPNYFMMGLGLVPATTPFVTQIQIAPALPPLPGAQLGFFALTADPTLTTVRLSNATVSTL